MPLFSGLAWPAGQVKYYMDGSGQAKIPKSSLAWPGDLSGAWQAGSSNCN
jgi:hypothetical protein